MMKLNYIGAMSIVLASQVCTLAFADISPSKKNIAVSVEREPITMAEPIYRAYVTAGNVKFTFIIPDKFHMSGDAAKGSFRLEGPELSASIVCTFLDADVSEGEELKPESFREMLARQHPIGKITDEFKGAAMGKVGPGFDIQWKSETGIAQSSHVLFVPTAAGVLQITATASGIGHTQSANSAMQMIVCTLNASGPDGKLAVMRLGRKM